MRPERPTTCAADPMKIFAIGAFLITFPAIVVAVWAMLTGHRLILIAAILSTAMNTFPFVAAMFLLRKDDDTTDLGH